MSGRTVVDWSRYIDCLTPETSEAVADLLRGLRTHGGKLLKGLQEGDVERAQLGLGHAYSRSKVKFSVNRLVPAPKVYWAHYSI